ncbi:MAG: hypothetical protein U0Y68_17525 [Blastocatellia bacterium]
MVWKQLETNNSTFATLSKDGVNLNDDGHKLLANHVIEFLAAQEKLTPSPLIRVLPMPLLSDEMTYGELKAFAEITHSGGWKLEPTTDKMLPASLLVADKANTEITASFEGTVVGLTFRMGPDAGIFECLIDGKPAPEQLRSIDAYDKDAHIATRILATRIILWRTQTDDSRQRRKEREKHRQSRSFGRVFNRRRKTGKAEEPRLY